MLERLRCEVLNMTYEPLRPVSVRRGIQLILTGKATLLEEHPTYFLRSADDIFPVPVKIVLRRVVYTKNPHTVAAVNNRNLFTRDGFTCQYCGRHKSELRNKEMLTRDHIHPRDKGGDDTWANIVTACNTCNNKKSNHLLAQSGMRLLKPPTAPTQFRLANAVLSSKYM